MNLNGLEMTWLGHAAFRLRLDDGTTLYVDPWLTSPTAPAGAIAAERADAIFVTHGHSDHLGDALDLCRSTGAPIHAIHEICVWAGNQGLDQPPVGSNKGGTLEVPGGVHATLVDAVHSSGISTEAGIVAAGEAGGWVLAFQSGPTIYHAGDTTVFKDMELIGELYEPDIALLPIGGWYTMGPRHAALAGRLIGAGTVVPIHYGTFPILSGTPAELREHAAGAFEVVELEIGVPVG